MLLCYNISVGGVGHMKSVKIMYVFNIVVPLLAGVLLYLFLRDDTYIHTFFPWFAEFKGEKVYSNCFLRFYLPDWLWAYSLTFALTLVYDKNGKLLVSILSGILFEVLQALRIINGTFDYLDITMYISASLSAEVIIYIIKRRRYR